MPTTAGSSSRPRRPAAGSHARRVRRPWFALALVLALTLSLSLFTQSQPETPTGGPTGAIAADRASSGAYKPVSPLPTLVISVPEPPPIPAGPDPVRAVFIGDSFTVGAGTRQGIADGLGVQIAEQLGWRPVVSAGSGSGYVAAGRAGRTYVDRIRAVRASEVDVLVVAGSSNDVWHPAVQVRLGSEAFDRVARERFPNTRLVVVGVMWGPADINGAPSTPRQINDILRETARDAGALFVDPQDPNWMTDMEGLMSPDRIHPNEFGYRYLAERAAEAIRNSGAITPAS